MSRSGFSPTPEQQAAIDHRSGAAIVSAAAGSGKTAVLVERVLKLLLDPEDHVNADEMIITTFTVKAAAEMKERLMRALSDAAESDPGNALIQDQMLRLSDATISTINSFCLGLLRKHGAVCGLPSDFSISDEAETQLCFTKALNITIENFCENAPKKDKRLIYDRFSREDDRELAEALTKLHGFSRTLPDSRAFFDRWLDIYRKGEYPPELLRKYIKNRISEPLERLNELCGELEEACRGMTEKHEAMARECRAAAELISSAGQDGCDRAALLALYKEVALPATPKAPKGMSNENITPIRAEIKKTWDGFASPLSQLARLGDDLRATYPVFKKLVELTYELDRNFTDIKRGRNKLDFTDVELIALDMLRDGNGGPSAAAREIAASTSVIIVDEFQDSNEIQYEIFRLISRNMKNLYFVGDIKQSIYAFRGADPSVFSRLTESGEYKVLSLNRNFRSSGSVIDSVNGVFLGTMKKELGGVDYDGKCALIQGASYDTDDNSVTELVRIYGGNSESARASEAAYIADRIKYMVRSGFTVTDHGEKRPCGYGDFAVLMGKYSTSAYIYKNAFRSAGVPFDAKEDENYTDFREVRLMLSLLRVIDNPYGNYDLAAVMMCPPYMFTPDEMAEVKLAGGKKQNSLFTGLKLFAQRSEKARRFLDEIRSYREFAAENTTEQLIRMLYDECPLIPAMQASPNGGRRDTNLKKLIGYAAAFEKRSGGSLYDFLNYMENLRSGRVRTAQAGANSGSSGCVRIMTIHNSKGLEFPVCFIANLSSEMKNNSPGKVVCSAGYGVGITVVEPKKMIEYAPLPHELITDEKRMLERSESMRLLYVAMTRAKEKLIMTVPMTDRTRDDMHYGWVKNSRAVSGGLIKLVGPIYGYKAQNIEGIAEIMSGKCRLSAYSSYSDERLCRIPAKVTATQIGVKSVDDFSDFDDKITRFMGKPSFLEAKEAGRLTGKKLGDAYHKALERLDLSLGGESASAQLDSMYEAGRLSEAERSSISDEAVAAFLDSELCRRAAKSADLRREYPIFCEFDTPLLGLVPDGNVLKGISDTDSEKPIIQGIVDMLFLEEDGVVLVDYKTNRVTSDEQLTEEYSGQLAVYAYAIEQMLGKRVKERLLYSFSLGRGIPVE